MPLSYEEIRETLTGPGQPFEIEEIALGGVTIRNWKTMPTSMAEIVKQSVARGDDEFIVYQNERMSFAEHYARVAALSDKLVNRFGVTKGDRVAVAMRNYPEWCVAFWAAAAAGAVAVPLNAWWTADELEYGLNDSGTKVVFVDQQRLERVQSIRGHLPGLEAVIAVRSRDLPADTVDINELLEGASSDMPLPAVEISPDDPATIFYTSGTTGFPKGTLGTHRNFCSVVVSAPYASTQNLLRMNYTFEDLEKLQQEVKHALLLTVPLFHVTGCHGIMLGSLSSGSKMVMMYKWDPEEALELIERERVTQFGAVPTMVLQLVEAPGVERHDLSSVLNIAYGGAPAAPELLRRIKKVLPSASVGNGWGITETSSVITMISGDDYERKPEGAGPAVPVCEVKAVDENGEEVPAGELGELWVRGPNVVSGYWNKSEATSQSFTDGWFHTGDIGKIDDEGCVFIVDRLKDMIIRGGENVYCAEVEAALLEHPAVHAACVFGVPHEVLGEEVAGVVETHPEDNLTVAELEIHVGQRLAKFKVPTRIWTRNEPLPLGATGKIQKKELKEFYIAQLQS